MIGNKMKTVAAAALAVAMTFIVAPAASAHTPDRCVGWRTGVFDGYNYRGTPGCFHSGAPDLRRFRLNNAISSAWVHDSSPWCLYDDFNYRRPFSQMAPNGHYPRFADWANNRAGSIKRGACPASFGELPEPGPRE